MGHDPRTSRNGIVGVSWLETKVVGIKTSSNGNFEMKSRITALYNFMSFPMLEKDWGGGVVKRLRSVVELVQWD